MTAPSDILSALPSELYAKCYELLSPRDCIRLKRSNKELYDRASHVRLDMAFARIRVEHHQRKFAWPLVSLEVFYAPKRTSKWTWDYRTADRLKRLGEALQTPMIKSIVEHRIALLDLKDITVDREFVEEMCKLFSSVHHIDLLELFEPIVPCYDTLRTLVRMLHPQHTVIYTHNTQLKAHAQYYDVATLRQLYDTHFVVVLL